MIYYIVRKLGVYAVETVSGANNWKLVIRREAESVTILRAVTWEERAALPETLFGLPVTVLGTHALCPTAREEAGEEVQVVCGLPAAEPEWNNRRLRQLTLPKGLLRVEDYALLNCDGLETLRLWDGIRYWGGGVLMNCLALRTFHLTRTGEQGEALAYFAYELSRELDVTVREGEQTLRLLFPEYIESYEENCPAHHFDYTISGAGYPYHHCFRQKKLNVKDYDALWSRYLGMEHDPFCAMRLAFWRLRYPYELSEQAEERYRTYLQAHAGAAAAWLTEERDPAGLQFLLAQTPPDRAALTAASAAARETGAPEMQALLLEALHRQGPAGREKSFDL